MKKTYEEFSNFITFEALKSFPLKLTYFTELNVKVNVGSQQFVNFTDNPAEYSPVSHFGDGVPGICKYTTY
jgi:hypothetical protein